MWTWLIPAAFAGPLCDALRANEPDIQPLLAQGLDPTERCTVTNTNNEVVIDFSNRESYSSGEVLLSILTLGVYALGKEAIDTRSVTRTIHLPPLVFATMQKQIGAVGVLLEAGAPVDLGVDENGTTALQIALQHATRGDDLTLAGLLLEAGAHPGTEGVLSPGLAQSLVEVSGAMALLQQHGADLNTDVMYTAMTELADRGRDSKVDAFRALGIDWRDEMTGDFHPLPYLVGRGDFAAADALLAKGADLSRWGPGILTQATLDGHIQGLTYLEDHGFSWQDTEHPEELLLTGVRSGSLEMVEWLLERNVPTATPLNSHWSALDVAVWEKNQPIARRLIEAGLPTGVTDDHPHTILHATIRSAASRDRIELAGRLGIPIDAPDARGRTALMWAVEECSKYTTELLIEKGASLHQVDSAGQGLLHHAARCHSGFLEWISTQDPDRNQRDNAGNTALHLAAEDLGVWEEEWLAMGFALDARRVDGQTPLHSAVVRSADNGYRAQKWARALLEQGADVDSVDESGTSILQSAVAAGEEDVVVELLRHQPVSAGVLWVSAHSWPDDAEEIVEALLRAGHTAGFEGGLAGVDGLNFYDIPDLLGRGLHVDTADFRWAVVNRQLRIVRAMAARGDALVDEELWFWLLRGEHHAVIEILEAEGVQPSRSVLESLSVRLEADGAPRSARRWVKRALSRL